MESSNVHHPNKKTGPVVGQVVIAFFMLLNVYLLLTKVEMAPKLLAGGSFVLLLGLFIFSLKRIISIRK